VSQLKPKQIILHSELYKTKSTYLQRNLKSKHIELLNQEILYLGPSAFKRQCRAFWRHLQLDKATKQPIQKLVEQTSNTSKQQEGESPEQVKKIQFIIINQTNLKNLHKNIHRGISERGLYIARGARPIFTKQKWKLFRKSLEKNFIKSI
tara:strand:+ start:38 stop:487 length:450 start_codon:yes stop_codon:yes gene_type:complete